MGPILGSFSCCEFRKHETRQDGAVRELRKKKLTELQGLDLALWAQTIHQLRRCYSRSQELSHF